MQHLGSYSLGPAPDVKDFDHIGRRLPALAGRVTLADISGPAMSPGGPDDVTFKVTAGSLDDPQLLAGAAALARRAAPRRIGMGSVQMPWSKLAHRFKVGI
jgi:hypothetical protein